MAAYAALKNEGDSARAAGDLRSKGQMMADELVRRVTGQATAEAVPVCIDLVLDADALLGFGAGTRIIGAAPPEGRWIRRLFTRPETGQLVATESRQRCTGGRGHGDTDRAHVLVEQRTVGPVRPPRTTRCLSLRAAGRR